MLTDSPGSLTLVASAANAVSSMPSSSAATTETLQNASRVPVSALNSKHATWTQYCNVWEDLYLLSSAGAPLREQAGRFLDQRPKEIKEIYQARIASFTYQDIMGRGIGWYVAKLFSTQPQLNFRRTDAPAGDQAKAAEDPNLDFYTRFSRNCDRNGSSLSALAADVFRQLLLYQRCYVLVDVPQSVQEATNAAEQIIEPYLSTFDPRFAYNWGRDSYGALNWIVFYSESIDQPFLAPAVTVRRWYYFDKQNYRVYEQRSDEQDAHNESSDMARLMSEGRHAMADIVDHSDKQSIGRVPVIEVNMHEILWLGSRVYLQVRDHLNTDNSLKWGLFLANLAMPVIKTDGEYTPTLSEASFIKLRTTDSFEWAEPSGRSFTISASRLDSLREEIFRSMYLQSQGKSATATASASSGYAKEMDLASSIDVLNSFGQVMRGFLERALTSVATVRGDDAFACDVLGLSFDDDPAIEDVIAAQQIASLNIQSETFRKELQKSVVRVAGQHWDPAIVTECCEEIDAAPTQEELNDQDLEQKMQQAGAQLVQVQERTMARDIA